MIHTYCPEAHNQVIQLGQGHTGPLGGMTSKVKAAWMAAQQGCRTVIANGKTSDALLQVRVSLPVISLSRPHSLYRPEAQATSAC